MHMKSAAARAALALVSLVLLPPSLGAGSGRAQGSEEGAAAGGAAEKFPRFFNAKTMRVVSADDDASYGYAAFIPAARPAYDARMDASLPLARRINAGYRLPNVFQPGEWAPLRRFCTPPQQEEDSNGQLRSTRQYSQPVSWYTVLKTLFGDVLMCCCRRAPLLARCGQQARVCVC